MAPLRVSVILSSFLVTIASLSGALLSPGDGPFVVEFEIMDFSGEEDGWIRSPGGHCSSASREGSMLTLGLWPDEKRRQGPWLAAFPKVPDHLIGIGKAPFKTSLPVTLHLGVDEDEVVFGDLAYTEREDGNATIVLDGAPVTLPHSWEVKGEDGSWKVEATLYAWEGDVKFERYDGYCMM